MVKKKQGKAKKTFIGHTDIVGAVDISADGKFVVSGSNDKTIRLWDLQSGKQLKIFSGHRDGVNDVVFTQDARFIISSDDYSIRTWSVESAAQKNVVYTPSITSFAISNDGNLLLAGSAKKNIELREVSSGKMIRNFVSRGSWVNVVATSSNGRYIVSGTKNGSNMVWDLLNWTNTQLLVSDIGGVNGVSFVPASHEFVSGGFDKTLKLWDIQTSELKESITGPETEVSTLEVDRTGTYIVTGTNYGVDGSKQLGSNVRAWQLNSESKGMTLTKHKTGVNCLTISYDNRFVISGGLDGIKLTNIKTGDQMVHLENRDWGWVNSISAHSKYFVAGFGNYDYSVRLFDVTSGRNLGSYTMDSREQRDVKSVSFSPDGSKIVFGSRDKVVRILDVERMTPIRTLDGHEDEVESVVFSPDGKFVYSGSRDGTTRIWNAANGNEVIKLIAFSDKKNWMATTSDGYYYGSQGSFDQIHYIKGMDVIRFDQFDLQFNRPDIILERLGKASSELISAYKKAWEKRVRKMGFKPSDFNGQRTFNLPQLNIGDQPIYFEVSEATFPISFSATDKQFKLERLFIEVNGVPLFGVRGKPLRNLNSSNIRFNEEIRLSTGLNIIKVAVMNEKGVESLSERLEVNYSPKTGTNPNLHLIAIGVSDFQQSEFNLTYANKDANDISQTFSNGSGDFENVVVHTLTNEQATRENVLALRNKLEQTEVDDEVIVFIASHGLLDEELDYYLAMHDTDFANPKDGGLRYDELEALIDGIPARNKAMFIDACHSGEVDKEESELVAANDVASGTVKSRGFKRVKTKASNSGIGLKTSFELMKELFADLRRNNGAIVISSASGQEYAFESSEWQNGVFTYSLLEGLKSGNADLNKDGEIVVSEIRDYVAKRVQELTNGKQNPTSRTENLENDFRVW